MEDKGKMDELRKIYIEQMNEELREELARLVRVCLSRYETKMDALLKLPCTLYNFITYQTKIVIIFDAHTPFFTIFFIHLNL